MTKAKLVPPFSLDTSQLAVASRHVSAHTRRKRGSHVSRNSSGYQNSTLGVWMCIQFFVVARPALFSVCLRLQLLGSFKVPLQIATFARLVLRVSEVTICHVCFVHVASSMV